MDDLLFGCEIAIKGAGLKYYSWGLNQNTNLFGKIRTK